MRHAVSLIILILISRFIYGQDTIPVIVKQGTSPGFVDFYPYKKDLVALAKDGNVFKISLDDVSVIPSGLSTVKASAIGIDRGGMIWAADSMQNIYKSLDDKWIWERRIAAHVWSFLFDTNNELFLLTNMGVYDSKTEMFYGTNKYRIPYPSRSENPRPASFSIDDGNNIWFLYISRIGTEVQKYSTKGNRFYTTKDLGFKSLILANSVFGGKGSLFFTRSDWFGMSTIYSVKKDSLYKIYENEFDPYKGPTPAQEEFIGAGYYDESNEHLYYYSSKGIQRAKYNATTDTILNQEKILPSQNSWINNEPDKAGFALHVKKMIVHNDILIYLNQDYGIFIYKEGILYNLK